MLIRTVIWPVCIIVEFLVLYDHRLLVTSSDCGNWGRMGVIVVLNILRGQVQRNRDEWHVFFVMSHLIIRIFLNFLNCRKIIQSKPLRWLVMIVLMFNYSSFLIDTIILCNKIRSFHILEYLFSSFIVKRLRYLDVR